MTPILLHTPYSNPVLKIESPSDEGVVRVPSPGDAGVKIGTHPKAVIHLAIQWNSRGFEKLIVCGT